VSSVSPSTFYFGALATTALVFFVYDVIYKRCIWRRQYERELVAVYRSELRKELALRVIFGTADWEGAKLPDDWRPEELRSNE
jgi:hypothetical protein